MTEWGQALAHTWRRLPRRDRQGCVGLAVFLCAVTAIYGGWLPAQQRLDTAQSLYAKRQAQTLAMQRARPVAASAVFTQPLSTRLSASIAASGLNLQQFEMSGGTLRITLDGRAQSVLVWLNSLEHQGAKLQSLTLHKVEQALQAQLLLDNPSAP